MTHIGNPPQNCYNRSAAHATPSGGLALTPPWVTGPVSPPEPF